MTVTIDQFDCFFQELWGYGPYPWQRRLARRVCNGDWPPFIDLPTASGKTACLDVAVFALAVQAARSPAERSVGRRIFFVVNRRVIVDEAHERACCIARELLNATPGTILHFVGRALRHVSGDDDSPPLDVAMMRGGIVRDNRWARSITQPTIITSTIDQVGSRLLFRGYGVSSEAAPLHAALLAHDTTILLDEAHISQPFVQTLDAVRKYRGEKWAEEPIRTPFHFVQMTATPGDVSPAEVFPLDDEDRKVLNHRHGKPKWVHLHTAGRAKGKRALDDLAAQLATQAVGLHDDKHRNIAIVVNRIATARKVHELLPGLLPKAGINEDVCLVIGRMRPLDRDHLVKRIQKRVGKLRDESQAVSQSMFVVATQCLEVGADFDFDAMVSECASIDALRQRFGRLNRTGRDIEARGCIVTNVDQVQSGDDPIYGPALAKTWAWLQSIASDGKVDFAVNSMNTAIAHLDDISTMLTTRADAPVMFPAYVDMWVQTSPLPMPSPDVTMFLHGPQRGEPDVNVCWRDDLPDMASDDEREEFWVQIVSLCPPSSPECMSVPIGVLRKWLSGVAPDLDNERSDLLDEQRSDADRDDEGSVEHPVLVWRGVENSKIIRSTGEIKPGDTIVLPVSEGGWDILGHIPNPERTDIAEEAYRQSRGRVILRLPPARLRAWPEDETVQSLRDWLVDPDLPFPRKDRQLALLRVAELAPDGATEMIESMRQLAGAPLKIERYPGGKGVVLESRTRAKPAFWIPAMDDGEDEPCRILRDEPISLEKHLKHVRAEVDRASQMLCAVAGANTIGIAADLHDAGKADERFQALLINGTLDDAWAQRKLWAKSANKPRSRVALHEARRRSGLPDGFRHEVLSVQLAEMLTDYLPSDRDDRDLVLHLIAAHHGRARPFAPVVIDDKPPNVVLNMASMHVDLAANERRERPPHRLDSGIAERFWKLTRRFGWWGLAYLEAILRLADQRASEREDRDPSDRLSEERAR